MSDIQMRAGEGEPEATARATASADRADRQSANSVPHTPGPWFVKGPTESGDRGIDIGTAPGNSWGYYTATIWGGLPDGQMEANAHLMAAAPELLAALKMIVAMYGPSTDYSHEAAAAWRHCEDLIAKAEGR